MKQEIPKPVLFGVIALAVVLLGFVIFRGLSAGDVVVDPKNEEASAKWVEDSMNRYSDGSTQPGGAAPSNPELEQRSQGK